MVDFAGWEMPQHYTSVREEHAAVRGAAGLFDVSHMGRVAVRGPGAGAFLQRLVTNDVGSLAPGHAQYNLLCNEAGGILDDLVVYRLPDGSWSTVVNASNREPDVAWMQAQAAVGVEVVDNSAESSLLALQGPRAESVLAALAPSIELSALPYFGVTQGQLAGVAGVGISRTGYTGEDGFELFVPATQVGGVWDAILVAGSDQGVLAAGLAARDVCRLEAGLRLYGNDMDVHSNPYQAGLGWTVNDPPPRRPRNPGGRGHRGGDQRYPLLLPGRRDRDGVGGRRQGSGRRPGRDRGSRRGGQRRGGQAAFLSGFGENRGHGCRQAGRLAEEGELGRATVQRDP